MIIMSTYQGNILQIRFIQESDLPPYEWINRYANKFRKIVNRGLEGYEEIRYILYSQEEGG